MKNYYIQIRVDFDTYYRISEMARISGRTKSNFIRMALNDFYNKYKKEINKKKRWRFNSEVEEVITI